MKPSGAAADSEEEEERSLEVLEASLVVVFVSVACWLGVGSEEGSAESFSSASASSEVMAVGGSEPTSGSAAGLAERSPSDVAVSNPSHSSFPSSSSSSLAPAAPLPHSLSFSDGGQVEVGVGVQESPSSLASSFPAEAPSAPRGFRWIRWWRTRLCFRVNVLSQV